MQIINRNELSQKKPVKRKEGLTLFLMAIPLMLIVIAFNYVPIFGWVYAFFDYKPGIPLVNSKFIGLESFMKLITDRDLLPVVTNTLALSFLGLFASPLPVILAIFVNEVNNKPFKKIFQTVSTLPNFISWVIIFSLSFSMFSSEGVVNQFLAMFHLVEEPINILGSASGVWLFQTLLVIWKCTGWNAIIYLAAITSIDGELYDAAKVDGAGRFRSILHITVPGIIPTFLVLLLLSVSNMLSVGFEQYLVFYNGLVADKITVLDLYVYRLGLVINDYSYATAVGIIKTLISLILLFSVNGLSKKLRGESLI